MDKFICIHGHFYQPPRENPWNNEIDRQETAAPFHDWNERIDQECYAPLAELGLYQRINFNFGPTLLEWMRRKAAATYHAILGADRSSQERFNGHGNAIAQCYNHMIMPLANEQDKHTQVIWGIRDFEWRFKRKPKGMWLPETAVDITTLEVLAYHGIAFTILAPKQAGEIKKINENRWKDVSKDASVETKRVYRCFLPSGKHIDLFFYDGYMAQHVAFGGYSKSATRFIHGIERELKRPFNGTRLIHCAVDGETYGHHNKKGHKVLEKTLDFVEQSEEAALINYSDYLERFPPEYEARIIENTAWSCEAGLNRWSKDDRHSYDAATRKVHKWRSSLRQSLDWLQAQLVDIYEKQMNELNINPWKIRNEYIDYLLMGNENFFNERGVKDEDIDRVRELLEMQKFAMFMFTSCGWFFEDIARIEAIQILRYAARAIELANELAGVELEPEFIARLEQAQSKDKRLVNGKGVYERYVKPLTSPLP